MTAVDTECKLHVLSPSPINKKNAECRVEEIQSKYTIYGNGHRRESGDFLDNMKIKLQ